MSTSTHVVGFKPPDAKWKAMKAVWDACKEAKIAVPAEIERFFEFDVPDAAGVKIDLKKHECCTEQKDASSVGYDIDLKKLPTDVTVIRFYNGW